MNKNLFAQLCESLRRAEWFDTTLIQTRAVLYTEKLWKSAETIKLGD